MAAAATRAALNVLFPGEEGGHWTPTLVYYTGYSEKEVAALALQMTETVTLRVKEALGTHKRTGLTRKFYGSRHKRLLKKEVFAVEKLEAAMQRLQNKE